MQLDPVFLANYLDAIERQNMPRYGKGGKVVDLLAESLFGGKKATKTAPDPSRRKIMGLDPKTLEPGQVAVKETVSKAPKSGTTSVTLEEIANIPMSRRDVLRVGAGQMGRGLLPQGALRSMMELAGGDAPEAALEQVMQQSVKGGSRSPTVLGAVARALYQGLEDDEVVRQVTKQFGKSVDENVLYDTVIPSMRDPWDALDVTEETWDPLAEAFAEGPLAYLRRSLGDPKPNELRASLREIKEADPFTYESLLKAARDTDMTIAELTPELTFKKRLENAQALAEKGGYAFDMRKFLQRYGYPEN